ncbi:hypothetical protein Tco_1072573 [Tanacetum coccineum]
MLYTCFTKLIINYFLSNNKSIPRRLSFKLHSLQDDQPLTKFSNTVKGDYKFVMEIPDTMISDAIKKLGYKFYMAKKVASENAKIVDKLEEQHASPVKSGKGKGFMCYGDQVVNAPNKLKKDVLLRKTRSFTIAEETVVGELAHSIDIDSDATLYSSSSNKLKKSANETDDADKSDMDLSDDNPDGDDDAASHPVYIDAQTTSVVHNPEGNPELTSYILGASKVPLGTHVDVLATKTLMKEMFLDENAHHLSSPPAIKMSYPTTNPQPNSLQTKAKKLMQKAKKNMRKFNFKKAIAQKFKEYDQKLEALTNFNVSEAFEKVVQAKTKQIFLSKNILNSNGFQRSRAKKFKDLIQKDELSIADPEGAKLERLKVQYNNDVELEYHVSQLKAAVLSEAQWNSDERDVSKPRSFERHMSKSIKPHPCFYNNDNTYLVDLSIEVKYTTFITKHYAARYYTECIEDKILERWSKEVRCYHFEALNARRSDDKEYEFSYADLPRLSVNDVEDIRTVIKNMVEDIQLGVESYQRTLNLTKPIVFFEGIDQKRIPFTMTATHKGVVYLNQYNIKSLMKLSEVKKFSDGTLVKIKENLIDILSKNNLGSSNNRLKGRDWTDYDVKSSREMLKKIEEVLRHREHLRRLEEYVGGRPKTINPPTFVRPL